MYLVYRIKQDQAKREKRLTEMAIEKDLQTRVIEAKDKLLEQYRKED